MYYENIYHQKLAKLVAKPNMVMIGDTFRLQDPTPELNVIQNPARGFDVDYAEKFFQWILTGSKDISIMHATGGKAKNFDIDYNGRCTAYGPRITDQLPKLLQTLSTYPESRRGTIMILGAEDQEIAIALHEGETKCEYPCTMGLNFWVDDGRLNMHTTMRSNNYVSTVCIDVYIFTRLMQAVASWLGLFVGTYHHHVVNAHILPQDRQRAIAILEQWGNPK